MFKAIKQAIYEDLELSIILAIVICIASAVALILLDPIPSL